MAECCLSSDKALYHYRNYMLPHPSDDKIFRPRDDIVGGTRPGAPAYSAPMPD